MFKDQRHYYLSGAKTFALAKQVHSVIVTKIFTAGLLNLDFTVIEYCELIAFTNYLYVNTAINNDVCSVAHNLSIRCSLLYVSQQLVLNMSDHYCTVGHLCNEFIQIKIPCLVFVSLP